MEYNSLLSRQMTRYLPEEIRNDTRLAPFLQAINDYYVSEERDRKISEHAFAISEREYQELYENMRSQNEVIRQSIQQLREAISRIAADSQQDFNAQNDDILYIISFLKDQIEKSKDIEKYLIQARDAAEAAAKAKSDFLSVMSHEIRTPLNAIIGYIHLLINENPLPAQVEYLNILQISARNLLSLINDVLDFSKIEEGKIVFADSDFDLRMLLNDIRQAHKVMAEENGNSIRVMVDEEIPRFLKGDTTRLTQILNNLISNAIKFTKKGKIVIELELKSVLDKKCEIFFSITDNGIGISEESQQNIFERFTQAHQYITRQFGGSGLGLAIIKKLLSLMGSDIFVESQPGKGSKFYFTLELEKSNIITIDDVEVPKVKEDLGGIRILLVEDVFFNAMLARKMLNNWNAVVDIAENGLIAVEKARKEKYDLILMDVQMPVMDGLTATTEIRKFNPDIPVFPLTASTSTDMQEKFIRLGVNEFIFKPINPDSLFNTISRFVAKRLLKGNTEPGQ